MVRHVVLFHWVDDVDAQAVAGVTDALTRLATEIDVIVDYRFGPDAGIVDDNADFALVATFASMADYEIYRDHPRHQAVIAEVIRPILARRSAVQFASPT